MQMTLQERKTDEECKPVFELAMETLYRNL